MSSLAVDKIFIAAIKDNAQLMAQIGGRLYPTAIPLPDESVDNVPVPYIIVTFDGLTNDAATKDDPYESDNDVVNIGIEITAKNRAALAALASAVRSTIHSYMLEQTTDIEDYQLSAEGVQYDQFKPCYWQTLRYQCDVLNS
jgi:hypothetical protein